MDALRCARFIVFEGKLALGVRPQVGHRGGVLPPDGGQFLKDAVGEGQRERHIVVGLVAGVAEHNALVAGALFAVAVPVHAHCDVAALGLDDGHNATGVGVEAVFAPGIADAADGLAGDFLYVGEGMRRHFPADDHQTGGHEGFTGDAGILVPAQAGVEDGVGNLVGHFVRMAFGNGF